jgi:hypothetical protein
MAIARVSQLQKQILRWVAADHRRTQGVLASSHQELVQALQGDKGNISHSLLVCPPIDSTDLDGLFCKMNSRRGRQASRLSGAPRSPGRGASGES